MNRTRGQDRTLDTHAKALQINLDARRYGTFAEIGAGQEVVRWFFRAGGASKTIAKSMSAYDMAVSDAIYGKAERYVCRPRLQAMLDHEHDLNLSRLGDSRGDATSFFAFADTVSALSYRGTSECHGWMGVKFQSRPRDQDSQIIIHVRMLDSQNALQQEALGVVGVNLLYGAFFLSSEPDLLIESLLDGLTTRRIEIDMIEFSGIEFRQVDNRLMSLKLVQLGLSGAAMFDPRGAVLQPSEVLYKKNVLVERGSFRPICHPNVDMLRCARAAFTRDMAAAAPPPAGPGTDDGGGGGVESGGGDEIVELMELTMRNLRDEGGEVDRTDFLARADMMAAMGKIVLVSDYFEFYRLAAYLGRHTKLKIALTMGVPSLRDLFDPKYYADLEGGILESFGRLFKNDLRLYVYPLLERSGRLISADTLEVAPHIQKLYQHLLDNGSIKPLEDFDRSCLHIFSRDVLGKIRKGDPSWEAMVPAEVVRVIKQRRFLGFR